MIRFAIALCIVCAAGALIYWLARDDAEVPPHPPLPRPGPVSTVQAVETTPPTTAPVETCDVIVSRLVDEITSDDVSPGDLVCLESGVRGPLYIEDVAGSEADPIVFRNDGGVTIIEGDEGDYAGIDIRGSSHIVVTGTGVESSCGARADEPDQRCGIVISGTGRGLAATEGSDQIAVDHLAVSNTTHSGIFIKTGSDEGITREDWTQETTIVVDNYLHDVGREGLYIGSSFYSEGRDPVLVDVVVERNLVVQSGWDGIQVGSAVEACSIRGNRVLGAGTENRDDQRSGIINNRGSVCSILDNVVVDAAAQGIYVQGNGGNLVADNLIVQPGSLSPREGEGITVTRGSNEGVSVSVLHNTIVSAPGTGVLFRLDLGDDNRVANNLLVEVGTPIEAPEEGVSVAGNIIVTELDDAGFRDPFASDFRLTGSSPAVDAGVDLRGAPARDLTGSERPMGAAPDAGAFEYRSGVDG